MKSIYEETLEIIDRNTKLEIIDRNTYELGKGLNVLGVNDRIKIEQALEHAQKQEQLLELYKELSNKIEVIDNAYGYGILGFDEIKHISEKIKELENSEINL